MFAFGLAKPDDPSNHGKTHVTVSEPHPPETRNRADSGDGVQQIAEALCELRSLLESYAPAWYTEQYDEKAASALRVAGRF